MSRKIKDNTPTDEEIMSYTNVPVEVAAKYIGWSSCNVAYALQQERAPFGMAAQTGENPETGFPKYTYNISPGLLVKYKNGELQAWRLNEVLKLAADGYQQVIDAHLAAAAEAMTAGVRREAAKSGRQAQGCQGAASRKAS